MDKKNIDIESLKKNVSQYREEGINGIVDCVKNHLLYALHKPNTKEDCKSLTALIAMMDRETTLRMDIVGAELAMETVAEALYDEICLEESQQNASEQPTTINNTPDKIMS